MTDKIRGALFDILGGYVYNASTLDLYAGSGAVGIEALSRGAQHAEFVERDPVAVRIIRQNLSTLGLLERCRVYAISVEQYMANQAALITAGEAGRFNLIFADPPYDELKISVIEQAGQLLKAEGIIALSYSSRLSLPAEIQGLKLFDNRTYGDTNLGFLARVAS